MGGGGGNCVARVAIVYQKPHGQMRLKMVGGWRWSCSCLQGTCPGHELGLAASECAAVMRKPCSFSKHFLPRAPNCKQEQCVRMPARLINAHPGLGAKDVVTWTAMRRSRTVCSLLNRRERARKPLACLHRGAMKTKRALSCSSGGSDTCVPRAGQACASLACEHQRPGSLASSSFIRS